MRNVLALVLCVLALAVTPSAPAQSCANGSCAPSSGRFQLGPVFSRPRITAPNCAGGVCAPAGAPETAPTGFDASAARSVDPARLEAALRKMKEEGRSALTETEFNALFTEPAGKVSPGIVPRGKKLKNSNAGAGGGLAGSLVFAEQDPNPMGEPMPVPGDNFGVDFEKLRPGRATLNGTQTPLETARGMLAARAAKFDDISGKRWVVVVGNPQQQKDVISQFTPAMIREMTLKTLTPEQVKERDLNFVALQDEPVITVCEPDGTLVMNKTGANGAQRAVGQAIGQKYDPAKDPDAKQPAPAVPTPTVPATPAAPNVALPQSFLDFLKYILPLLLGFFGGGEWAKRRLAQEAAARLNADQQKQLAALLEAQKAKS